MSQISKARCVVRNCGKPAIKIICEDCFKILATGVIDPKSSAWFVTELVFMAQQNDAAMEQVRHLHAKVNELLND